MQPWTPTTVLLTAEDVQQWQEQLAAAEAVVAGLKRKLNAAAVFFPEIEEAPTEKAAPTVGDSIATIVAASPKAMTPRDIRNGLSKLGFDLANENYLYTAIKRLADRNVITKTEHGYVSSKGSSKEESPDLSAGASQDIFTRLGGGVGAHPEAGGT